MGSKTWRAGMSSWGQKDGRTKYAVGELDEFAHDGSNDGHFRFAAGGKALGKGSYDGLWRLR